MGKTSAFLITFLLPKELSIMDKFFEEDKKAQQLRLKVSGEVMKSLLGKEKLDSYNFMGQITLLIQKK